MVRGDTRIRGTALLLAAVFLLALNMRGTITGVGPLLPEIATTTGYNETVLGALTSIPMFMWAIVSPFVHAITARFGLDRTLIWALVVLGAASVLRALALPGELGLWAGTVLIGLSLAVINVLMPVATRRDFGRRSSTVLSINTNMLVVFAAAVSGLAVPISEIPVGDGILGWRGALLTTGILIPFALILWPIAHRRGVAVEAEPGTTVPEAPKGVSRRIWTDSLAWLIAWYMGLQSVQFFIISSWLTKMEVARGVTATFGGVEVMVMQIVGMLATLCLPLLRRSPLRHRLPGYIVIPGIAAALGIIWAPDLTLLWIIVLGIASGPCLAIPLILIAERSRDGATSTALSGMVQGFGYALSGFGPILFGWLHTVSGGWQAPMWLYTGVMLALCVVGFAIHPERSVLAPKASAPTRVTVD